MYETGGYLRLFMAINGGIKAKCAEVLNFWKKIFEFWGGSFAGVMKIQKNFRVCMGIIIRVKTFTHATFPTRIFARESYT